MKKFLLLALCAVRVLAAEAPASSEDQKPVVTAAASTAEATPVAKTPDTEEDGKTRDLEGKVESISEAFTELKNTVDSLAKLKVSGYVQGQYVKDDSSVNELTSASATRNKDQFTVRRARAKFVYQHSATSRFVLQPDFGSSGFSLKEAFVEYTEPWTSWKHTLTAGQFLWPFGFENQYSSSQREVPEHSRMYRTLFPGEYDRGLMLSGSGLEDRLKYQVAVVNGTGTSQSFDFNKRKDVVARVGGSLGPLDLGVSTYRGAELVSLSGATKGREFDKTRNGIDVQYVTPLPGLGLRAEYMTGEQPPAAGAAATATSADVRGWYVYAIQNVGVRHQFVVRVDEYDPNTHVGNNAIRTITPAYNFYWDANSKVMLAYEHIKTQGVDPKDNAWTVRYQFSF